MLYMVMGCKMWHFVCEVLAMYGFAVVYGNMKSKWDPMYNDGAANFTRSLNVDKEVGR